MGVVLLSERGFLECLLFWCSDRKFESSKHGCSFSTTRARRQRRFFCGGAEGNACTSRNRSLRTEQNRQGQATDILVGRACFFINMRDTLCTRSAALAA